MITEYGRDDRMHYSLMPNFLHHHSLRDSDKMKEKTRAKENPDAKYETVKKKPWNIN